MGKKVQEMDNLILNEVVVDFVKGLVLNDEYKRIYENVDSVNGRAQISKQKNLDQLSPKTKCIGSQTLLCPSLISQFLRQMKRKKKRKLIILLMAIRKDMKTIMIWNLCKRHRWNHKE